MTFTGAINTLSDGTLSNTTAILGGSTGTIIIGFFALVFIGYIVVKLHNLFTTAKRG